GLQPDLRLSLRWRAEDAPSPEVAEPPAQPVEVLLLLVELGRRELLDPDLLVDLVLELAAFGEELLPFRLALLGEPALELRAHTLPARLGGEDGDLATGRIDHGHDLGHYLGEIGSVRERPGRLLE